MALILIFTSLFGIAVNAQEVQFSQIEFNAFEDLTIDTDNLTGFNTQNEAEDTLLKKYNSVKVKGSEKTVPIISWAIEENPASYDVKKPGKYTFIASLDSDFEMEFSDQTIIYPKINIIIKQAETPKITITKFSDFSNIQLNSTETDGFATLNEAKSSLLKKYSTVKVNGSQDELQISSWSFDEKGREYTPTKEGTYTFIASIADSEKYDTSKLNISLPKIKIVVTAPKGNAKIKDGTHSAKAFWKQGFMANFLGKTRGSATPPPPAPNYLLISSCLPCQTYRTCQTSPSDLPCRTYRTYRTSPFDLPSRTCQTCRSCPAVWIFSYRTSRTSRTCPSDLPYHSSRTCPSGQLQRQRQKYTWKARKQQRWI